MRRLPSKYLQHLVRRAAPLLQHDRLLARLGAPVQADVALAQIEQLGQILDQLGVGFAVDGGSGWGEKRYIISLQIYVVPLP